MKRPRLSLFILTTLLTTVFLICCGGDGSEAKPTAEDGAQADTQAQAAADAAIIKLEDLPAGWVETEQSSDESADPCNTKGVFREQELARSQSMDFEKEDDQFQNLVVVFPDAKSADEATSTVIDRMRSCDDKDILKALSTDKPKDVSFTAVEIGRVSLPDLGDRVEGLRLTISVTGKSLLGGETSQDIPYDYVWIRLGPIVSTIGAFTTSSYGSSVSQDMAELAAQKLEDAAMLLTEGSTPSAKATAGTAQTPSPGGGGPTTSARSATPSSTQPPAVTGKSRSQPIPRGQSFVEPGGWELTILDYVPDAWPLVQAENPYNEPPEQGYRMVLIRTRITNVSADDPGRFSATDIQLVGSENVTHTAYERPCGVIPDSLGSMSTEMFRGGAVEGNVCFQVPEQETSLVVILGTTFDDENRRYFAVE